MNGCGDALWPIYQKLQGSNLVGGKPQKQSLQPAFLGNIRIGESGAEVCMELGIVFM